MAPTQQPSLPAAKRTRIPIYTTTVSITDGTSLTPANNAASCSMTPPIHGPTRKHHPRPTLVPLATYASNPNAPADARAHTLRRGAPIPADYNRPQPYRPQVQRPTSLLHYLRGCLTHTLRTRSPNIACFPFTNPPSHSHRTAGPQTYLCDTVTRTYYKTTLHTPTLPPDQATSPTINRSTLSHTAYSLFQILRSP